MVTMFVFFMMVVLALLLHCNHLMDILLQERRLRMGIDPFDEDAMGLLESDQETSNGKCTTSC